MKEALCKVSRDEPGTIRAPRKKESFLPPNCDFSPRHRPESSPPCHVTSWSDPNDLSQLLDFFITPPLRTSQIPRQVTYDNSCSTTGTTGRIGQSPFKSGLSQSLGNPAKISQVDSAFNDSPKRVPLKAQRLMGIDTTVTFHRSKFDDWEDEEHLQSAFDSSRRSMMSRSRDDNRLLNRDSKWSTLSQRFRSNSTTPVSLCLRKSTSSPKSSFDDFLGKDNSAMKASSPDRTKSMIQTPIRPTFEADSRKISSESKIRSVVDRSEWAEARASSRALNNTMDGHSRREIKTPPSIQSTRKNSGDNTIPDVPLQILQSTPPLRFNPSRRPRATFPLIDQFDSSSADEGKGPDKLLPLVPSPELARCPSKILVPSRMMRPSPTSFKVEDIPKRPRRPTESNIFADKALCSPVKLMRSPIKVASPSRRMMSNPPRQPPPSIPIPPLPSLLPLDNTKVKQNSEKTDGLRLALEKSARSPSFKSSDKEYLQTIPETSPQAVVFCGEKVAQTFTATIKQVEKCTTPSEDQVELVVGGVSFEVPLSHLLNGDSKVESSGLVTSLRNHLEKQEHDVLLHKSSNLTLSVPFYSLNRRSKNTLNSYDDGISPDVSWHESSSSSEEESEEEIVPVFSYDTTQMTWAHQVEEIKGEEAIKTVQTLTPFRSLAHARSPTSVSLDCDESLEGDQEGDEDSSSSDVLLHRRNSATPELIGPHTFIFTSSSPQNTIQGHEVSSIAKSATGSLQVTLHRDPQPYTFLLHFLKTGSLPCYFSEECFSILDRQRALQRLCMESRWLGYSGLAEKCNDALDSMSTQ